MNMLVTRILAAGAALIAACPTAISGDLKERVDSLRRVYDFPSAVDACMLALKSPAEETDTADIRALLDVCRAGRAMMNDCRSVNVVAKAKFAVDEFIYYYPVDPGNLIFNPSPMDDSGGDIFSKAIYAPVTSDVLFFSGVGDNGGRDIFCAFREDNGWGSPMDLPEEIASEEDEIYPFVSSDGKSLYFSSRGHGSIGGFDLYVSHRNAHGEWSSPENLGFPYSSPFNDFLLYNTPDGKYTVFASDRDCPGTDSLFLYVLEYEKIPSRTVVDTPEDLRILQALDPPKGHTDMDNSSAVGIDIRENSETVRYGQKMDDVRDLRINVNTLEKELELLRARYSNELTPELRQLAEEKEAALETARAELVKATGELRTIEMEFLSGGVVIDLDKAKADSRKDVVGAGTAYVFTRMHIDRSR